MKFTGERMIPEFNKEELIYLEHISRYSWSADFVKDKIVLDIASGSGYGSDMLKKAGAKSVYGVDISEEAVEYSRKKYKEIDFIVGSVEKIPLEENSVDIVVSFETIEHVSFGQQKKFIDEVRRVLKEDGVFIVSTPNAKIDPKDNHFHKNELSKEEFEKLLNNKFNNTAFYYQDSLEGSYIVKDYSQEKLFSNFPTVKNADRKLYIDQSLFLLAVCSNKENDYNDFLFLSNKKPWERAIEKSNKYEVAIKAKDEWIRHLEGDIDVLKNTIESMRPISHKIKRKALKIWRRK